MLKGLRTVVYHVNDLEVAKKWYADVFGLQPYFDEPFYVGFNIGGYELGLDPDPTTFSAGNSSVTFWGVDDIEASFSLLTTKGVKIHDSIKDVGEGIKVGQIIDPFGNVIGLIENPFFQSIS